MYLFSHRGKEQIDFRCVQAKTICPYSVSCSSEMQDAKDSESLDLYKQRGVSSKDKA